MPDAPIDHSIVDAYVDSLGLEKLPPEQIEKRIEYRSRVLGDAIAIHGLDRVRRVLPFLRSGESGMDVRPMDEVGREGIVVAHEGRTYRITTVDEADGDDRRLELTADLLQDGDEVIRPIQGRLAQAQFIGKDADGGLWPENVQGFFELLDIVRDLALSDDIDTLDMGLFLGRPLRKLIEADGGCPGVHMMAAVRRLQQHATIAGMRAIAASIGRTVEISRRNGLVWGEGYLHYNDLDDSTCVLKSEFGNVVFHENTSLISDYSAFIASLEGTVEDGSLVLHMLDRNTADISAVMKDYDRTSTPRGTIRIAMDLATGVVESISNESVGSASFYFVNGLEQLEKFERTPSDEMDDMEVLSDFTSFDRENGEFEPDERTPGL